MISSSPYSLRDTVTAHGETPLPWWKRSLDLACALVALPALLAVGLVVALWLAIFSPGPVLFRQERVGYKGRRFMLYKFRSMRVAADTSSHRAHFTSLIGSNRAMQKLDGTHDNRLVPGSWLLRASGLDELPQLLNILRGDMSIVGPRPCIPYEYEQYSAFHRQRFDSAPGLTGLWQVSGKNRTTFEQMVRFDIEYGHRKSLWLDLQIMAKTLPALCVQIADTRFMRRTRKAAAAAVVTVTVPDHSTPTFQT
jgi:lipopolysaccharide/colanic/teichoic acid biosynthesis glycosyltransferase